MNYSVSWICPDCDIGYVVDQELQDEFVLHHLENCRGDAEHDDNDEYGKWEQWRP